MVVCVLWWMYVSKVKKGDGQMARLVAGMVSRSVAAMGEEVGQMSPAITLLVDRVRRHQAGGGMSLGEGRAAAGAGGGGDRTRKASVLVCVFSDEAGQLRVMLTKRAACLSTHSGEVALPGGKMEEGDVDEAATALREAEEEIGLQPCAVKVIANLETFVSKHQLWVTPVVALLPDPGAFTPVLSEAEVEDIFDAPLDMFLEHSRHRAQVSQWRGVPYLVHFFDYQAKGRDYLIWGLTAAILIRAASIILDRPPAFPEHAI